jgi:hypothetical protein
LRNRVGTGRFFHSRVAETKHLSETAVTSGMGRDLPLDVCLGTSAKVQEADLPRSGTGWQVGQDWTSRPAGRCSGYRVSNIGELIKRSASLLVQSI